MGKILVWDLPVRLGHWLLVLSFIFAWQTGDSEEWRLYHVAAGYAMVAIIGFRLLWGAMGTRYARFSSFLFSPRKALAYLGGLLRGRPARWVGHNPAGSYAIYLLLLLGLAVVATGWADYNDVGGDWVEDAHDYLSEAMLAVIGVHVLGVIAGSLLHRENLVRSMLSGCKHGRPDEAILSSRYGWAAVLAVLALCAGWLAFP